jgi:hypothetical protein
MPWAGVRVVGVFPQIFKITVFLFDLLKNKRPGCNAEIIHLEQRGTDQLASGMDLGLSLGVEHIDIAGLPDFLGLENGGHRLLGPGFAEFARTLFLMITGNELQVLVRDCAEVIGNRVSTDSLIMSTMAIPPLSCPLQWSD